MSSTWVNNPATADNYVCLLADDRHLGAPMVVEHVHVVQGPLEDTEHRVKTELGQQSRDCGQLITANGDFW